MSASDDDSSSEEQLDLSSALGQLDTLQASIEKIEEQIAPLLQLPLQSVTSKLPSVQAAKLQAALAYASSALFFIYLHSSGEGTDSHPVKKELERVKKYLKKIADATTTTTTTNADNSANTTNTTGPNNKIDKSAAKRFIAAQLASQSAEKKSTPVDADDSDSSSGLDDDADAGDADGPEVASAPTGATSANPASGARTAASHKRGNDHKRPSNKKAAKQAKR